LTGFSAPDRAVDWQGAVFAVAGISLKNDPLTTTLFVADES
jgi:hypothetical protein